MARALTEPADGASLDEGRAFARSHRWDDVAQKHLEFYREVAAHR